MKAAALRVGLGIPLVALIIILLDGEERIVRWGHTGEEDGVSCRLAYCPSQNLDVVILGNQTSCAGRIAHDIHEALYGETL